MFEQPTFDYNGLAGYCADKENWSKDRALREGYEWLQQAESIGRALQNLMSQNVALVATNNHLIELLENLDASHRIDSQVLANYKGMRMHDMHDGEVIIRQGMETNASLAAMAGYSKRQSDNGAKNRIRIDIIRDNTIVAMRRSRRSGAKLLGFIDAHLEEDSVSSICISTPTFDNGKRYKIYYSDINGKKFESKVAFSTLKTWWTSAKNPKLSKR